MNYSVALVQLPLLRDGGGQRVSMPAEAHMACRDLEGLAQESLHVLSLNGRNIVLNRHMVSLGVADATMVHPREVFRPAVIDGATSIVVVHNHPSGDPAPSAEDLRVTKQLIESGRIIGIKLMDHVIIGRAIEANGDQPARPGFLSLRECGVCQFE